MQQVEDEKFESAPPANPDRRADLRVSAPALDASQQPGFKVLEETPRRSTSKLVWTAVIVVVAILAAYALGYFR